MVQREPDSIAVCPLRSMPELVGRLGASHLVSILNAHLMPATPAAIAPEHHLKIAVNDIAACEAGARHPSAVHFARLVEFVRGWDRRAPLLIHCFAGLSRSPAAAYIALCALNPQTPEQLIEHRLRQASETAAPNRLMAAVADQVLERHGRLAAALDTIGPGSPAAEGRPFALAAGCDRSGREAADARHWRNGAFATE